MEMEAIETDRISNLPVFLLHKILSHLSRKDSARTSTLSKRWNSLWNSFPFFDIHQNNYNYISCLPVGNYLLSADKSLRNFVAQNKFRMERLDVDLYLGHDYIPGGSIPMVDTWLPLALRNGVSQVRFKVVKCPSGYPLPETTFASSESFRFLRTLKLSHIRLCEEMIEDIIRNCPLISVLDLQYIQGRLKTLEISKLDRLESLSVGIPGFGCHIERVSVDAALLKRFRCECERFLDGFVEVYLNSCWDLKELKLTGCNITEDLFHSYLSRFPLIEDLCIETCPLLRRIRISLQQLKCLDLDFYDLEAIQIDAPNLSRFNCKAYFDFPSLFLENAIPCAMDLTHNLNAEKGHVGSFSFLKIREFLNNTIQCINFALQFNGHKVSFDPEDLTEAVIPPVVEVDHLKLNYGQINDPLDYATLLEGILWSCHPKKISISSYGSFGKICIKILCQELLQSEYLLCCNSSSTRLKCWRHSLKGASVESIEGKKFMKIESVGGIEDKQLHHLLDTVSSLYNDEVCFRLAWDH